MNVFKKLVVRYLDAQGRQVRKGTPGATRVQEFSRKYYGRVPGTTRLVPLAANKIAAELMLANMIREAEMGKAGIADPYKEHHKRPLAEHLKEFEASLLAKGDKPKQARQVASRAKKVIDGCGFVFITDLSASRVLTFLSGLREQGRRPLPPLEPGKEKY